MAFLGVRHTTIGVSFALLFLLGCSAHVATSTPAPVTATPMPTPTPTLIEISKECYWFSTARTWIDENQNGIWDTGEPPLPGVDVGVVEIRDAPWSTGRATDHQGIATMQVHIKCDSVPVYRLVATSPPNYRLTTQESFEVDETNRSFDFGFTYLAGVPTATTRPPEPVCVVYQPLGSRGWVWDIEVTSDGKVWIATSSGAARFDSTTESWITYTTTEGLVEDKVKSITAEPDGTVWLTTWDNGAASSFDGVSWTHYTMDDGLLDSYVSNVSVAPDGSVWFASPRGASHWNRETDTWTYYTEADGLFTERVMDILFTPDGKIWFAALGGVTYLTPASSPDEQDVWHIHPESEESWEFHTGYDTAITSSDGRIWFGGDRFFNPDSQEWVETVYDGLLLDSSAHDLAVDGNGGLWIATEHGVIYIPDPLSSKREAWQRYGIAEGLAGDDFRSMALEADNVIWFGSEDAKVSRCIIETGAN